MAEWVQFASFFQIHKWKSSIVVWWKKERRVCVWESERVRKWSYVSLVEPDWNWAASVSELLHWAMSSAQFPRSRPTLPFASPFNPASISSTLLRTPPPTFQLHCMHSYIHILIFSENFKVLRRDTVGESAGEGTEGSRSSSELLRCGDEVRTVQGRFWFQRGESHEERGRELGEVAAWLRWHSPVPRHRVRFARPG